MALIAKKAALVLISVAAAAFCLEAGLEFLERSAFEREEIHRMPFYSTSFYTASGARLSKDEGLLKLQLDPTCIFRNMPGQKTPYFSINSQGLRGPEIPLEKSDKKRIVLLGGSAAFGSGLPSDEDTLARQLELLMPGVEVVNAAVTGHESGQELTYFAARLDDWRPDLVLTLDGWNDFVDTLRPGFQPGLAGFNGFALVNGRLDESTRAVESMTARLLALPAYLWPLIVKSGENGADAARRVLSRSVKERHVAAGAGAYARNIEELAAVARGRRARFLCVVQALSPGDRWAGDYEAFRKEAERRLLGADWLDLNEAGSGLKAFQFMDSVHLDAEGNRIMAALIVSRIKRDRLLR